MEKECVLYEVGTELRISGFIYHKDHDSSAKDEDDDNDHDGTYLTAFL
jgi:hypothetical protein